MRRHEPAWMTARRHHDATALLGVALIVAILFGVLVLGQYRTLQTKVTQACAATEAAGKLDLASFVPICGEVKP